jgi:hypothetical protein
MLKRLIAFVLGDMVKAEDLSGYPKAEPPPILERAAGDPKLGAFLLTLAIAARDRSDAAVAGIQSKAAAFLTLVIGLFPLFLAAVALAVPPAEATTIRWVAFVLLIAASSSLAVAAVAASLAAGMSLTASINIAYLEKSGEEKSVDELTAQQAGDWSYAAALNLETSRRRAADLFRSRQSTVIAMVLAAAGLVALLASVGGHPCDLVAGASVTNPIPTAGTECLHHGAGHRGAAGAFCRIGP